MMRTKKTVDQLSKPQQNGETNRRKNQRKNHEKNRNSQPHRPEIAPNPKATRETE